MLKSIHEQHVVQYVVYDRWWPGMKWLHVLLFQTQQLPFQWLKAFCSFMLHHEACSFSQRDNNWFKRGMIVVLSC